LGTAFIGLVATAPGATLFTSIPWGDHLFGQCPCEPHDTRFSRGIVNHFSPAQ
jgi:hypothetical protein